MLFRTIKFFIISFIFIASVCVAENSVIFNVAGGDKEDIFMNMINKNISDTGFVLSDPHERVNDVYSDKYSSDDDWKVSLDNLGFFTVVNDTAIRPLLLKEPSLGAFSLFNLHIYKKIDEDNTYIGHILPTVMLDISGVTDKSVRADFIKMFKPLDALVNIDIGGKVEYLTFDSLPSKKLMEFELKFNRPDDIYDFIDKFQDDFEDKLEDNKFIIAGYKNFSETYADMKLDFSKYDVYFVYSLCQFEFSYRVFNFGNPQAGVFAPCSMYMYIEKDSNVLKIGMPYLQNWITTTGITQKNQIDAIHKLDKDIIKIMADLGAKLQ